MDKVHVIVNPFSARGKTIERWETIKEIIRHHFNEYKAIFTEKPKQATEIARDSLQQGADIIIGVGGDGTLNEITNGYFHDRTEKVINPDAALGIVPSGTGSDFIRFLKIPGDFKRSVALIKNSRNRKIDVGKITFNFPGADGGGASPFTRFFINVADFGLGAEVVKTLHSAPGGKHGALSYYTGLLSTIRKYKSKPVSITIDDKETISGSFLIGAVANGRIFGGGMQIAPGAEPDDGLFDLVLVGDMTRFQIIKDSRRLYTGTIASHPRVIIKRARNIKVFPVDESQGKINIEYDGEMGETLPAEFQVLTQQVKLRI